MASGPVTLLPHGDPGGPTANKTPFYFHYFLIVDGKNDRKDNDKDNNLSDISQHTTTINTCLKHAGLEKENALAC